MSALGFGLARVEALVDDFILVTRSDGLLRILLRLGERVAERGLSNAAHAAWASLLPRLSWLRRDLCG